MLKEQIILHNLQIKKAKEVFKDKLSPQAIMIIENMQLLIDWLIKEKEELESIISEDSVNWIGRI